MRTHVDVEVERVAPGDPARRVHDDRVAGLGALRVQRPLHGQRPAVAHVHEDRCMRPALERELERRRPALPGRGMRMRRVGSRERTRRRRPGVAQRAHPAAVIPRCAQPVIRRSSTAKNSYITIAITPITNRPANTSGMRIDEPAAIIR